MPLLTHFKTGLASLPHTIHLLKSGSPFDYHRTQHEQQHPFAMSLSDTFSIFLPQHIGAFSDSITDSHPHIHLAIITPPNTDKNGLHISILRIST
jgi:hypothetical protein